MAVTGSAEIGVRHLCGTNAVSLLSLGNPLGRAVPVRVQPPAKVAAGVGLRQISELSPRHTFCCTTMAPRSPRSETVVADPRLPRSRPAQSGSRRKGRRDPIVDAER
jgi:hypothetical protein